MIDSKRTGMRCRAKVVLRTHTATIQASDPGTIVYEVENEGRRLILVQWDSGPSMFAFPEEIEIIDTTDPQEFW
jgi:anti-sigma regulatory factor (Ser/Thr protein kinase)